MKKFFVRWRDLIYLVWLAIIWPSKVDEIMYLAKKAYLRKYE